MRRGGVGVLRRGGVGVLRRGGVGVLRRGGVGVLRRPFNPSKMNGVGTGGLSKPSRKDAVSSGISVIGSSSGSTVQRALRKNRRE